MSSTSPKKKRVGRTAKLYTSDQLRDIKTKYHNFQEMVDFAKKYVKPFEIHCTSSASAIVGPPTKTRRRFTQKKKEVYLHYFIIGNHCETVRAFDINKSTVRGMINARPFPDKMKLSSNSRC